MRITSTILCPGMWTTTFPRICGRDLQIEATSYGCT
jgi:hypothetical protein